MAKLLRMMLAVVGAILLNKMFKSSAWPSANSASGSQANRLSAFQKYYSRFIISRSR
jgi:hypothetical protein